MSTSARRLRDAICLSVALLASRAGAAPPSGYQCGKEGKPLAGKGCQCGPGKVEARDKDNVAICVAAPKPKVASPVPTVTPVPSPTVAPLPPPPPPPPPPVVITPKTKAHAPMALLVPRGLPDVTSQRSRALVITEIAQLEALFKSTVKTAPDRPQLLRRLAESYRELESIAFRDAITADINESKKPSAKEDEEKARKIEQASRLNAIKYYGVLIADHPTYTTLDEVTYLLAREHEKAGAVTEARKRYYEIITKFPQSKLVPYAYLAFGDLFFDEAAAASDPSKWELARQAYEEVTKYPAPENKALGYAFYRLGYVLWYQETAPKARAALKKADDFGTTYSALPGSSALSDAAKKALEEI